MNYTNSKSKREHENVRAITATTGNSLIWVTPKAKPILFLAKQSSNSFSLTPTQNQLLLGDKPPAWLKLRCIHLIIYILFKIRKNKNNTFQSNIIVIFLSTHPCDAQQKSIQLNWSHFISFISFDNFTKHVICLFFFLWSSFFIALEQQPCTQHECSSSGYYLHLFQVLAAASISF